LPRTGGPYGPGRELTTLAVLARFADATTLTLSCVCGGGAAAPPAAAKQLLTPAPQALPPPTLSCVCGGGAAAPPAAAERLLPPAPQALPPTWST
jgi:hypothetical protein